MHQTWAALICSWSSPLSTCVLCILRALVCSEVRCHPQYVCVHNLWLAWWYSSHGRCRHAYSVSCVTAGIFGHVITPTVLHDESASSISCPIAFKGYLRCTPTGINSCIRCTKCMSGSCLYCPCLLSPTSRPPFRVIQMCQGAADVFILPAIKRLRPGCRLERVVGKGLVFVTKCSGKWMSIVPAAAASSEMQDMHVIGTHSAMRMCRVARNWTWPGYVCFWGQSLVVQRCEIVLDCRGQFISGPWHNLDDQGKKKKKNNQYPSGSRAGHLNG